jgi:hypothetical protein
LTENYFFTEIEDHFRAPAGPPVLLSPLDWALIEAWKNAGIPLEAMQYRSSFRGGARGPRAGVSRW